MILFFIFFYHVGQMIHYLTNGSKNRPFSTSAFNSASFEPGPSFIRHKMAAISRFKVVEVPRKK